MTDSSRITGVHAREVLDSRGNPTVEVDVFCADALQGQKPQGRAIVPSGASTGKAEAHELRDGDMNRFAGRGVLRAVANVNETLGRALIDFDAADQFAIDARLLELDGTPQKTRLGANAVLGVSLAVAHAGAAATGVPLYQHINRLWNHDSIAKLAAGDELPTVMPSAGPAALPLETSHLPALPLPMTNMISGGLHAGGNLDFQDFLLMPVGAPSYHIGLEWLVRVHRQLGTFLIAAGYEGRLLADEGGYGPRLTGSRQALDFLMQAIEAAGLTPLRDMAIALDVASSHFFQDGAYHRTEQDCTRLTSQQMIDQLEELVSTYPILSIEDGLAEDDWEAWQQLTRRLSGRVRLVGDDLFATNPHRLRKGIALGAANSVLIKVNQIGTLTETLQTMRLAQAAGYTRVVSARSGETEDTTMVDLAVGTAAELIKIGSVAHGERQAKYNQLLRVEEMLGAERRRA